MNKKILSIIFSLFLIGVFSVSCSIKKNPKGIEHYNGNIYAAKNQGSTFNNSLLLSIKDNKVNFVFSDNNNTTITKEELNIMMLKVMAVNILLKFLLNLYIKNLH
ncbi:hypothetical protein [Brachyspira pilosicoli]|uniref:hypothetical protein n=1 Tax=Brachyspira pilosicoli TaxID=52584 RepID=UPI0030060CED